MEVGVGAGDRWEKEAARRWVIGPSQREPNDVIVVRQTQRIPFVLMFRTSDALNFLYLFGQDSDTAAEPSQQETGVFFRATPIY